MSASYTVIFVMAAVAAIFVLLILRGQKESRQNGERTVRKSWGSVSARAVSADAMQRIRSFSDALDRTPEESKPDGEPQESPSVTPIDDITAEDLELDRFYQASVRTMAAPGDEVYYSWLRHPLLDPGAIRRRIRLEDFFSEHPDEREAIQLRLLEIGREKDISCYGAFEALDKAQPAGRIRYLLLSALTAADLALLFFLPLPAVLMLIPLMAVNISVHLRMKEQVGREIRYLAMLIRMQRAAAAIAARPCEAIRDEQNVLRSASARLASFRRGAVLVTSGASVGTGPGNVVLEYAKLFFHADLIRYNGMLRAYREHRGDALAVYRVLGNLDAVISCSSYIASRPRMTRPVFAEGRTLTVKGLVHPLLEHPVPADFRSDRCMLLTGSNASGKSTFLKAVMYGALMAQSIGAAAASGWEAPCFRIFTSMALSDSLKNGESYFVVEIRSLKRILDAAGQEGSPVLAAVDEVLRGTNTVERIAASSQILRYLAGTNALVFAATHDIELSYLLQNCCENRHFGETVRNGDVTFDYHLREGRASSGNAIRLLRATGYPAEVTEAAGTSAARFEADGEWHLDTEEERKR